MDFLQGILVVSTELNLPGPVACARLRELGASHYVLESWGNDNSQYRFACEMSVGVSGMNRRFEAHESDPWRAMDSVLRQVEDWRNAPRQ